MPVDRIFIFLGSVCSFLMVSSLVTYLLCRRNPHSDYSQLVSNIKSWWVMMGVGISCVYLGKTALLVLFACISGLALKEYLSLAFANGPGKRLIALLYACVPLQFLWISLQWYDVFIVFIPVLALVLISLSVTTTGSTEKYLATVSRAYWGLIVTVFCLSHIGYLLQLPVSINPNAGIAIMLFLLVLTQLNDVSQYIWGNLLGKQKIAHNISPNKTKGGLIGGIVTVVILSVLLGPWLTPMSILESFGAGIIICFGGFFGDLSISAIKREFGRKDTGDILPGHGGILDRVDSLTFTAPMFFHYLRFLHFPEAL